MVRTLSRLGLVLALACLAVLGGAPAFAADPVDLKMYLNGPAAVAVGQTGVYTAQIGGQGRPDPASTRVVLTLPAGVTWESAEPGAVGCVTPPGQPTCGRNSGPCRADAARRVVTCTVDHPEDELYSYTATVRFTSALSPGTPAPITASVTAANDGGDPADNTVTVTTTAIAGSDLSVTAIPPAGPVTLGRPVKYTLVVHNAGPAAATAFNLREILGDGWFVGRYTVSGGGDCFPDLGELTCDFVTNIAPGADLRLDHVLESTAEHGQWGKAISIRAEVSDSINPANNVTFVKFRFAAKAGSATGHTPSATASPSGGGLPITGPGTLPLVAAGLLLLLAGAGTVVLAGRRI